MLLHIRSYGSKVIHKIVTKSQHTVACCFGKTQSLAFKLPAGYAFLCFPPYMSFLAEPGPLLSVHLLCHKRTSAVPGLPLKSREHGREALILGLQT